MVNLSDLQKAMSAEWTYQNPIQTGGLGWCVISQLLHVEWCVGISDMPSSAVCANFAQTE